MLLVDEKMKDHKNFIDKTNNTYKIEKEKKYDKYSSMDYKLVFNSYYIQYKKAIFQQNRQKFVELFQRDIPFLRKYKVDDCLFEVTKTENPCSVKSRIID